MLPELRKLSVATCAVLKHDAVSAVLDLQTAAVSYFSSAVWGATPRLSNFKIICQTPKETKCIALLHRAWRPKISIFSQFHQHPNFTPYQPSSNPVVPIANRPTEIG